MPLCHIHLKKVVLNHMEGTYSGPQKQSRTANQKTQQLTQQNRKPKAQHVVEQTQDKEYR